MPNPADYLCAILLTAPTPLSSSAPFTVEFRPIRA
jgi:hypothetical protein